MATRFGRIERIGKGHKEIKLPFGFRIKASPDSLCIYNGQAFPWYEQLGVFDVARPHNFRRGDCVEFTLEQGKIIAVRKMMHIPASS